MATAAAARKGTLNASQIKPASKRASLGPVGPSFAEKSEHLAYEKLIYQPLSTNIVNYEEKDAISNIISPVNSDTKFNTEATKEAHVQEYDEPELPASIPN